MTGLPLDLRLAWERLRRDPWTSLAIVAVLTLGIGMGGTLIGWIRPLLLTALPYPDSGRLVYLWQTERGPDSALAPASLPDFEDWRHELRQTSSLAGYQRQTWSVADGGGGRERRSGLAVTASIFELLQLRPQHGRVLSADEDRPEAAAVVMLGDGYWRNRFGADPAVIGSELDIGGEPHRIIGVLPAQRGWALQADLWRSHYRSSRAFATERGVHSTTVIGRLSENVSLADASGEHAALSQQLIERHPDSNAGRQGRMVPMHQQLVAGWRDSSRLTVALAGLLLLTVACNLVLLLGARAQQRRRLVAVQAALGASPLRLWRQALAEQLLLATMGIAFALLLAWSVLAWLRQTLPMGHFDASSLQLDAATLLAMLTLGAGLVLLVSLGGLLSGGKTGLAAVLAENGRGSTADGGQARLARRMQSAQVAMGLVSASVALLIAGSALQLARVQPGFDAEGVVQLGVELPPASYPFPGVGNYPSWPRVQQLLPRLEEALAAVPGVRSVALAQHQPLDDGWTTTVRRSDLDTEPDEETTLRAISPGYLQTLGIPLLAGRDLTADDRADAPAVVLVNQAFAQRWFGNRDPLGASVHFFGSDRQIVGVIGNTRFAGLAEAHQPAVYPPLQQTPFSGFTVLARLDGDPALAIEPLRRAINSLEAGATVFDANTLGERLASALQPWRLGAWLALSLAGTVGLLLLVGLFALLAADVGQRQREIAVRRTFGAGGADLGRWLLNRLSGVLLPGLGIGLLLAWWLAPLLASQLYGLPPRDPRVLALAVLAIILLAAIAASIPLRRTLKVTPMEAMRG